MAITGERKNKKLTGFDVELLNHEVERPLRLVQKDLLQHIFEKLVHLVLFQIVFDLLRIFEFLHFIHTLIFEFIF